MRTINLTSPQNWQELTPKQLLFISDLYLNKYEESEFLTRALIGLAGLIPVPHKIEAAEMELLFSFRTSEENPFQLTTAEMHEMSTRLKWLLESPGLCTPPSLGKYIPVNNRLFGVPLEQYLLADAHYIRFAKTKDRSILDKFAAALYRNKENELWNDQAWKNRIPKFSKRSMAELNAVFIWFTGVKAFIMAKYPYVFPNSTGSGGESAPDEQILQLLANLNGGDVTRNRLIMETHVHEVLFELNLKIENSQQK
ncbi:MAG: hypothetical protein A2066_12825 [Bacteroidetes bacterium GWB2_41_8]|nr:MAG: hypothetical protein A2066_12825 [Bacteroidetes bacterium GWB2_41_8]